MLVISEIMIQSHQTPDDILQSFCVTEQYKILFIALLSVGRHDWSHLEQSDRANSLSYCWLNTVRLHVDRVTNNSSTVSFLKSFSSLCTGVSFKYSCAVHKARTIRDGLILAGSRRTQCHRRQRSICRRGC